MNNDFSIEGLSNSLYEMHKIIGNMKKKANSSKTDVSIKILNMKSLLLAARTDVSICFKGLTQYSTCEYESFFFFNTALLKMHEITKKIRSLNDAINYSSYPQTSRSIQCEITELLLEWKTKYEQWTHDIRTNSAAHYDLDINKYMESGFTEIDLKKNTACFKDFIILIDLLEKQLNALLEQISNTQAESNGI